MIEVQNLTKHYGAVTAVRDVSFAVAPGEIVGFLGPNGAGKSTTMRILACFMPASAGLAKVAAIKSQSFATGGAFTVPGGMGGGDRVRTVLDLEPGEFVEVSSNRPDGYQSGTRRGGAVQTILVQIPEPGRE